jgi:hypothetical protein
VKAWASIWGVAILVAVTIALVTNSTDTDEPSPVANTKVVVNKAPDDGKPTTTIEVPKLLVDRTDKNLEDGLKNERPTAAVQDAPQQLEAVEDTAAAVKGRLDPLPTAGASAGFAGCVTRFVSNQSSRRGVRPIWQVLHYTVSPNRPGWSDVNAVVALFNRPSSQASSHFVIDAEGHCAYIVPIEAKAWTEAAGNSLSVGYEVINSGSERAYMATPGYAKLRSVMLEVSRRTGIPLRAGSVYPARSGIVQHKDGGLPWGGHFDIAPFSKSLVIAQIVKTSKPYSRARDLRRRNKAAHKALRDRRCSKDPSRSRGVCLKLHRRHQAIHRAARRAKIRL